MEDCRRLVNTPKELYGVIWDEKLTQFYAEQSPKMYDELTSRGVSFTRLKRPIQTSVNRLAAVEDTKMFPAAFQRDFSGPNVKTCLRCSAQRLITDSFGDVTGVQVHLRDGIPPFTVHARKVVVLATGGYGTNPSLRRHFQPNSEEMSIYSGLPTCRGDGQLIGQAVGGDLINMAMIPPIVAVPSHLTEEAIAVNLSGNRFHDEAGPYSYRVYELQKQDQKKGHYIFDSETYNTKTKYVNQMPCPLLKANSVESIAFNLGIPAATVEEPIRSWNSFLASGDPDRSSDWPSSISSIAATHQQRTVLFKTHGRWRESHV